MRDGNCSCADSELDTRDINKNQCNAKLEDERIVTPFIIDTMLADT